MDMGVQISPSALLPYTNYNTYTILVCKSTSFGREGSTPSLGTMTKPNLYLFDNYYFMSARTYAENNNISIRQARKQLRKLVATGVISYHRRNNTNGSMVYRLLHLPVEQKSGVQLPVESPNEF